MICFSSASRPQPPARDGKHVLNVLQERRGDKGCVSVLVFIFIYFIWLFGLVVVLVW